MILFYKLAGHGAGHEAVDYTLETLPPLFASYLESRISSSGGATPPDAQIADALVRALAAAPRLHTLCTQLPTVWNVTLLEVCGFFVFFFLFGFLAFAFALVLASRLPVFCLAPFPMWLSVVVAAHPPRPPTYVHLPRWPIESQTPPNASVFRLPCLVLSLPSLSR